MWGKGRVGRKRRMRRFVRSRTGEIVRGEKENLAGACKKGGVH